MGIQQHSDQIEILLVEDNAGDARLTQEGLKDSKVNYHLCIVEDGVEAIAYLRKQGRYVSAVTPDFILLDLNLPKKDGREVLAEIKADPQLKHIPVVVLTTSQAEHDILKSYDLHANCYITKPVDLEQSLRIIQAIENFWLSTVKLPRNG